MVRKRGREEFEKRVAAARDFFEWWIERETSAANLDSLGSKMQLAQKLAETIGRVQDPMMRGEVANLAGQETAFGIDLLFEARGGAPFTFHIEICEDLWVPQPPSAQGAAIARRQ